MQFNVNDLKYNEAGLIPAIIQEADSKEVLMMAWMNKEAVAKTLDTKETWFYSRSRKKLWHKGESSGHVQKVRSIYYDCDADTLLVLVEQRGPGACHEGYSTCFHYRIKEDRTVQVEGERQFNPAEVYGDEGLAGADIIDELYRVILERQANRPEGSYTTYLFNKGVDKICKKVGEESAEVIIAAKNQDVQELTYESADLIYHLLVLMADRGVTTKQLFAELEKRRK
ncbi:bifunctional phosphoribosyl-AMP cyclohydrolase/phosphoribosyl-ATP diphosphatase HisIE [Desulfofalx alkaliphila]|uniref:bifunctional phosphoribosyl-AMP cyclohydrolase/phosphoribosyl-ATP diphosphatase HisIE n=1 Tax=Desulfofalx alkaliphila TaxID=105483 RepID=UPI0004E1AEDB|nr:bifunctional phosphoribosyl-AMP cyclohydrolase/phosphoribosyl-ATP diphosphatase HisIE [Desulfofalx alkaliphila]